MTPPQVSNFPHFFLTGSLRKIHIFRLFAWLVIFSTHCSLLQTLSWGKDLDRCQEFLSLSWSSQWRPCIYPWSYHQWVPDNTICWQVLDWSNWRRLRGILDLDGWYSLGIRVVGGRRTQQWSKRRPTLWYHQPSWCWFVGWFTGYWSWTFFLSIWSRWETMNEQQSQGSGSWIQLLTLYTKDISFF